MKRFIQRYEDFMERQGFYWLCGLCALVILLTALWTSRQTAFEAPQAPARQAQVSQDESLLTARQTTPLPSPSPAPLVFQRPVTGKIKRGFSNASPVRFEHTGHWQLHTGCDYETSQGEIVRAVADGTVLSCRRDQVIIQHAQGYESRYLGLASAPYVKAGDPVAAGQTIGHGGQGPLWERGEGSHLHLEILRDSHPVDPETLLP